MYMCNYPYTRMYMCVCAGVCIASRGRDVIPWREPWVPGARKTTAWAVSFMASFIVFMTLLVGHIAMQKHASASVAMLTYAMSIWRATCAYHEIVLQSGSQSSQAHILHHIISNSGRWLPTHIKSGMTIIFSHEIINVSVSGYHVFLSTR